MEPLLRDLATAKNIVFFTGAGVSTPSGLKDFRGTGGLGEYIDFEAKLNREQLLKNPNAFWDMWHKYLQVPETAMPNIIHKTIGEIGKFTNVTVITQNIDGFHEQFADSSDVLAIHGTSGFRQEKVSSNKIIKRPNAVLYGEILPAQTMKKAVRAVDKADLLIAAGTSLSVYPATGLVQRFMNGRLYYLNNTLPDEFPVTHEHANAIIGDLEDLFQQIYAILTKQPRRG